MPEHELIREVKLATRIYFLKKYIPRALLITAGFVIYLVLVIAVLSKGGRPSKVSILFPVASLILYPILIRAGFMDMKDKFYARPEEEIERDLDSIVQSHRDSSSHAKGQVASAYSLFDKHYKLFIFLAILFVAFAVLLRWSRVYSALYYIGAICWFGALFVRDTKQASALGVIGFVLVLVAMNS